jgi:hypothetical protein
MRKINWKKILGYAILTLIFGLIFFAFGMAEGFLYALIIFGSSFLLIALIALAVNLIVE